MIVLSFVVGFVAGVLGQSGCRDCTVNGQRYPGNSRFQFTNGCIEYNCRCECNGGWECPSEGKICRMVVLNLTVI